MPARRCFAKEKHVRLTTSPSMPATQGAILSAPRPGTVVTPTRLPGLAAALRRWFQSLRDGWRAVDPVDELDAATLRDIGLSHAAAAQDRDPYEALRAGPLPG